MSGVAPADDLDLDALLESALREYESNTSSATPTTHTQPPPPNRQATAPQQPNGPTTTSTTAITTTVVAGGGVVEPQHPAVGGDTTPTGTGTGTGTAALTFLQSLSEEIKRMGQYYAAVKFMTSASLPVHMTTGNHYLIYSLLSLAKSKRVCLDPSCRLRTFAKEQESLPAEYNRDSLSVTGPPASNHATTQPHRCNLGKSPICARFENAQSGATLEIPPLCPKCALVKQFGGSLCPAPRTPIPSTNAYPPITPTPSPAAYPGKRWGFLAAPALAPAGRQCPGGAQCDTQGWGQHDEAPAAAPAA
ncbi:hypothetical protein Pelo_3689 [Pelomyxa schiedti]|nr:hypothetical protein Pelo_3689 [Pelomyxa schiedti]